MTVCMREARDPSRLSGTGVPWFGVIAGTCAVVALAYWLGASWLANPVLGIPMGVWAVPIGVAIVRWGDRIVLDAWLQRVADSATGMSERLTGLVEAGEQRIAPIARSLVDRPASDGESRVRVGLAIDADPAARLMAFGSGAVQMVALDRGQASRQVARQLRLDAILADRGDDGWRISVYPATSNVSETTESYPTSYPTSYPSGQPTLGSDGSSSDWPDWSLRRRLSYATVFPTSLVPDHVSLGRPMLAESFEAELLAALVEAAGAVARGATLADRRAIRPTLMKLSDLVVRAAVRRDPPMSAIPAARLVGAWLSTYDGPLSLEQRCEGIEAASAVLGRDAESMLRVAAARFAAGEDDSGLEAIESCEDQLLALTASEIDQVPFVLSELECGSHDDDMLVGRVAAGLRLAAAGLEGPTLERVVEDTEDDIRHAPVLIGRDPEAALLLRVLRGLVTPSYAVHEADAGGTQLAA